MEAKERWKRLEAGRSEGAPVEAAQGVAAGFLPPVSQSAGAGAFLAGTGDPLTTLDTGAPLATLDTGAPLATLDTGACESLQRCPL